MKVDCVLVVRLNYINISIVICYDFRINTGIGELKNFKIDQEWSKVDTPWLDGIPVSYGSRLNDEHP